MSLGAFDVSDATVTTKAEKIYLDRVAQLGCIVCLLQGIEDCPAEIHHPRNGQGKGQRAPHRLGIPLCPPHHRTGGYGVAIHAGQKAWEAKFGTEIELVKKVRELLGMSYDDLGIAV